MKTITLKQLCNEININFIEIANDKRELKNNEYYALVVVEVDYNKAQKSPYVRGIEPYIHKFIVGIEKCSGVCNWYISKDYAKRKNLSRGITIIVEVDNTTNFSIL